MMIMKDFITSDEPIKMKNVVAGIKDQLPLKRLLYNFFVTGNAWGMFSESSHSIKVDDFLDKPKVCYNTKTSASKAATKMEEKHNKHFSVYKCVFCDGYHIGKNRNNK